MLDYLIVGGGMSGLSLALELVRAGAPERTLLVVEPRREYARDRTFCMFDGTPHRFEAAITHRWPSIRARNDGRVHTLDVAARPYVHIRGDAFYRVARDVLETTDRAELRLGVQVTGLRDAGDRVIAETSRGPIEARVAFDSRPVAESDHHDSHEIALAQHFAGWIVRADRPVFDDRVATLMDFDVEPRSRPNTRSAPGDVHFMYELPFDERTALIEDTYFSPSPHPHDLYEANLERHLRRRLPDAKLERTELERGVIPMATRAPSPRPSERIYRIGVAAGLAKPSTGYAFVFVQRFVRELVRRFRRAHLVNGPLPDPPEVRNRRDLMLDRVFLSYLARHPERGPLVLERLFAELPSDVLIRFLTEEASPTDILRVMNAMPRLAFTLEAVRSHRLWLSGLFDRAR